MAKFGGMPMPKKGKKSEKDTSMANDLDLFGDEETPEETDGTIEDEGSDLDLGEDKKELAALSDDELMAECKKRGLKIDESGKGLEEETA